MHPLLALENCLQGKDVVLLGNSGYLNQVPVEKLATADVVMFGVNAAPAFCASNRLQLDYHVLFDWRFLDLKKELVIPHLSETTVCLWGDQIVGVRELGLRNVVYHVPFLGYDGFSVHPAMGCFSGHTVAYVALQLLNFFRPSRVFLLGIDMTYGKKQTRFYQDVRGRDVELHVRSKQVTAMARGAAELIAHGIEVYAVGDESYLRGHISPLSLEKFLTMLRCHEKWIPNPSMISR